MAGHARNKYAHPLLFVQAVPQCFFFGISLAIEIFGQTDELATVLQNRELSAAVAQTVVEATLNTLKSMNSIVL